MYMSVNSLFIHHTPSANHLSSEAVFPHRNPIKADVTKMHQNKDMGDMGTCAYKFYTN